MQLRHIRPGSLEWQDAKSEEVEPGTERLTPEEIIHLREQADQRPNGYRGRQHTQAEMQ